MPVKILVVDDDPHLAGLVKMIFKEQIQEGKLEFAFAFDGQEALELLQADWKIDVLFTDIRMPRMDGLTLLAKVSEHKSQLNPVLTAVVMSAFNDMENIRNAMNGGAFDFVPKPINMADFRVTMTKVVEHVQGLKRARKLMRQKRRELNEAYEALARANEQLLELDRLKSAFISLITHELRTPFVNINFSLELLGRYSQKGEWPEVLAQVEALEGGIEKARKMVDTLVVFAQFFGNQGELTYTWLDIGEVVEKSLVPCRELAESKGINLSVSLAEERPFIEGDEARLNDAVFHLVSNAIKFTDEGGDIWVRVYSREEGLFFEVEDAGRGVEPDRLEGLWESFNQLADRVHLGGEGLGLGLAVVNYVVKAHGGDVFVTSRPGEGSGFGFRLPLKRESGS